MSVAELRGDPTERRGETAANPAATPSGERLASTLDHAGIGIIEVDAQGRLLRVNARLCELMGYSEAELIGRSIFNETHVEDLGQDLAFFARQVAGELDRYSIEKRIARRDGTHFWAAITSTAVRDAEGRFLYAVRAQHDITDRKRAEESLARRMEEQAALFEFSKTLQRAETAETVYAAALDAIIRALGCSRASVLLADANGALRFVAARGLSVEYRQAVDGHSPWTSETRDPDPLCIDDVAAVDLAPELKAAISKEGIGALAFIPLLRNTRLIGKFMAYFDAPHRFQLGEIEVSLAIARQLAFAVARLQAEEARRRSFQATQQLASIVESSDDAIASKDMNGIVTSWNKGAERLFGYTAEEMIGRPIAILIPDDRQNEEPQILTRIRLGERMEHFETVRRHKDGRLLDVSLSVSPMRDEAGRIVGASKIARDITERKRAETQQRTLLNELNHRVKNNMQLLQSLLSAAARNTDSAEAKTVLRETGDKLAAMAAAHRVLYATPDAMRFDAAAFLDAVCQTARQAFPAHVRIDCQAATAELSNEAAMPLALILNELLTNALKHGLQGGDGVIKVRLEREHQSFLLSVEDSGRGFALDDTGTRSAGLRLVEGLTRQLRGRFDVTRQPTSRCTIAFS